MRRNKKEKQTIIKIGKLLLSLYPDNEFIIEILSILENDEFELLKEYLEANPDIVAGEICDKVSEITGGRYIKEFPVTRAFRIAYAKNDSSQNLMALLEVLSEGNLQIPCTWEMTEEETEHIKKSEIGDEVHIDSQMFPILIEGDEAGEILIPACTSQYEISADYRKEYAVAEWSWSMVRKFIYSMEHVTNRKVLLWLDGFSNYSVILTKEMIDA